MVIESASRMEEAGSTLDLEITESVIMEDVDRIVPIPQPYAGWAWKFMSMISAPAIRRSHTSPGFRFTP